LAAVTRTIDFLKYHADHWVEAFKASTGCNMPIYANIVPEPMPILSDDPTSHPHRQLPTGILSYRAGQ
jgi:multiple sugar transport system substrate-binding protein